VQLESSVRRWRREDKSAKERAPNRAGTGGAAQNRRHEAQWQAGRTRSETRRRRPKWSSCARKRSSDAASISRNRRDHLRRIDNRKDIARWKRLAEIQRREVPEEVTQKTSPRSSRKWTGIPVTKMSSPERSGCSVERAASASSGRRSTGAVPMRWSRAAPITRFKSSHGSHFFSAYRRWKNETAKALARVPVR